LEVARREHLASGCGEIGVVTSCQAIEILWEDNAAMVVNKPAGCPTQAARSLESVETRLRAQLAARPNAPAVPYLALAHRLDRPVSGALLVARNIRAARRFGGQFQSRKVGKCYLAICEGRIDAESAAWVDWLRKIPGRAEAEVVSPEIPGARRAALGWERLAELEGVGGTVATAVRVTLETGRMHQIRLQFAHRGWPLVGDAQYGATQSFGPEVADPRRRLIALHAWRLAFHHPKTGVRMHVTAPVPAYWMESFAALGQAAWLRAPTGGG
jgi:23S rRNA pseudouridine1911/1915/1917 synthase